MTQVLPKRAVSKSKFSMYLRTLCDRELYLSLFSNNPAKLSAAQIPIPLKSRPGVQLITASGREFEYEQFDILIAALPNNVLHKSNGRANVDIVISLTGLSKPTLILQPELEPENFREVALPNLGVSKANLAFIPPMAGLRPDVVLVDKRRGRCHVIENWTRLRRNLQLQLRRDDFTPRLQGRCPEGSMRSC